MDTRVRLGRQIRERREARGLSLRALSDRCGVSYQMISFVEGGQVNPTIEILESIARGLETGLVLELQGTAQDPTLAALERALPLMPERARKALLVQIEMWSAPDETAVKAG